MQIPTNMGPTTLTPSDIQNGMVFRDPTDNDTSTFLANPSFYSGGIAGVQEVAEALAADVAAGKVYFLGCDPRLTSRAGCERFGVLPTVDAAAHGFARLRDGGAMDLQQEDVPMGTIARGLCGRFGFNHRHPPRLLRVGEEFLGLRADIARREDVRQLCCGAEHPGDATVFGARCTLAIGEHEQHEDLATGVKWSATVGPNPKLIVGVDLAQRPRQPVTKDGASPSPSGTAWPFKTLYGDFTFEAGVASLPVRASYCKGPNDIVLRFVDVPSGDNLFTLRDMFTQMGRVRFTLRAVDGTMARYEATPNEVKTSPNYRLADATNIEMLLVDVKRVETADEYWSVQKPAPASQVIPDVRRAIPHGHGDAGPFVYASDVHGQLLDWMSREMSKAIMGEVGGRSAGAVHDACAREAHAVVIAGKFVPILKQSGGYNVWKDAIPNPFTIAVKQHAALVPKGCDATRWQAVVNVIGADVTEAAQHRKRTSEAYEAERDIGNRIVRAHETMSMFAVLRFVHGYDTKEATRRACERFVGTAHHGEQERLCRVYEAG